MSAELPSVPDAYAEYCYWRDLLAMHEGNLQYRVLWQFTNAYAQARKAWIDAEWQVNCASWRWLRNASINAPGYDGWEVDYWRWQRIAAALRFASQCDGIDLPGTALELSSKGVVA